MTGDPPTSAEIELVVLVKVPTVAPAVNVAVKVQEPPAGTVPPANVSVVVAT